MKTVVPDRLHYAPSKPSLAVNEAVAVSGEPIETLASARASGGKAAKRGSGTRMQPGWPLVQRLG